MQRRDKRRFFKARVASAQLLSSQRASKQSIVPFLGRLETGKCAVDVRSGEDGRIDTGLKADLASQPQNSIPKFRRNEQGGHGNGPLGVS